MSWSSMEAFDIDHKVPLSKFDISTVTGAREAFGYRNTQALPRVLHAVKTAIEEVGDFFSHPCLSLCCWASSMSLQMTLTADALINIGLFTSNRSINVQALLNWTSLKDSLSFNTVI